VTVTPAIEEYARKKNREHPLDFPRILDAHCIVEVDKFRQRAELVLHCGNHLHIEASGRGGKISTPRLIRWWTRPSDRCASSRHAFKTPARARLGLRHFDEQIFTHDLHEEHGQTTHIRTEQVPLQTEFVDEAVLQLEVSDYRQFLVFFNADSEKSQRALPAAQWRFWPDRAPP